MWSARTVRLHSPAVWHGTSGLGCGQPGTVRLHSTAVWDGIAGLGCGQPGTVRLHSPAIWDGTDGLGWGQTGTVRLHSPAIWDGTNGAVGCGQSRAGLVRPRLDSTAQQKSAAQSGACHLFGPDSSRALGRQGPAVSAAGHTPGSDLRSGHGDESAAARHSRAVIRKGGGRRSCQLPDFSIA